MLSTNGSELLGGFTKYLRRVVLGSVDIGLIICVTLVVVLSYKNAYVICRATSG